MGDKVPSNIAKSINSNAYEKVINALVSLILTAFTSSLKYLPTPRAKPT
ncbi:MAG: hypothetical protein IV090_21270 [Candidatus Sericytochromatia bacterium]|nr:hypothetical protein [Candidatus Sericytochromatia bacterium]